MAEPTPDKGGPRSDDPALVSRLLLRRAGKAALATVDRGDGKPYASLVVYAALADASPALLLSDLADHSMNLAQDPSCSLLVDDTAPGTESLAGTRLTVQGRMTVVEDDAAIKARIVVRHPEAAAYAGFGDFRTYRVAAERMHLIGGFGEIHWIDAASVLADAPELDAATGEIVAHMNADHADAVALYADAAGLKGGNWRMVGIDTDGIELSDGAAFHRIDTGERMRSPGDARRALAAMAKAARG